MLVVFDGLDGAGKTTQIKKLYEKLNKEGISCYEFDMGSHKTIGKYITRLKEHEYRCSAQLREILYYFEGHLFSECYRRELKKKYEVVLCDRWLLTYFAYGRNNGLKYEEIAYFTELVERPDICFYFELAPEIAAKRIEKYRNFDRPEIGYANEISNNKGKNLGMFLMNQEKIRNNFKEMVKKSQYTIEVIDASQTEDRIAKEIYETVKKILK